jgi:hypothetical protein
MKENLKKTATAFFILAGFSFFMTGCVEHRYYHEHHRHSPGYYQHHHMTPPPEVDINVRP